MKRQRNTLSSDSFTSDSSLSQSGISSQTEISRSPSPIELSVRKETTPSGGKNVQLSKKHAVLKTNSKPVNGKQIKCAYKNEKNQQVYSPTGSADDFTSCDNRREKRSERPSRQNRAYLGPSKFCKVLNNSRSSRQDKSPRSRKHERYHGDDKSNANADRELSQRPNEKIMFTSTQGNKARERSENTDFENTTHRRKMRCYRDRRDSSGPSSSSSGDRYKTVQNSSTQSRNVSENSLKTKDIHDCRVDRKSSDKHTSQHTGERTDSQRGIFNKDFDSSPELMRNRRSQKLQLKISDHRQFDKILPASSYDDKDSAKSALQNTKDENTNVEASAIISKFGKPKTYCSRDSQSGVKSAANSNQTIDVSEKIEQAMQMRIEKIQRWKRHHKSKSTKDCLLTNLVGDTPTLTNGNPCAEDESEQLEDDNLRAVDGDKTKRKAEESLFKEDSVNEDFESAANLEEIKLGMTNKDDNESEEDPLDEYMSIISQQIKELKQTDAKKNQKAQSSSNANLHGKRAPSDQDQKTVIVRTTISGTRQNIKGDIMEQNADALEYSSEEYSDDDVFANKKSKADTINTDHNKIYYRKFKKCFYSEVPEITNMTAEEVALLRSELDNINVTGKRCPKPIKSWAQCLTYLSILDTLKRYGMHTPTPIQSQALPIISSGRDMLGIAKTGSGKTLAFILPMLRHIKAQPPLDPEDGPVAIIITPTRELAMQIAIECKRYCRILDLRVVAVFGGTGISEQIADLKRGTEIVVCTPGRMIDMLAANNGKVTNLRRVTYVVIDEADRMFDMGFEPQVNKILECIRPDRQTVMFSATFPRQMEALARRALHKPIEVVVGGKSVVCDSVEQQVFVLYDDQKYLKLLELLGMYQEHGSVLVFVHKQEHADELMKNLLHSSYSCMALHGGIDQYDRDSVISDFKSGALRLLIATSLAARGLDVKELILVVNYDCPNHYEDYVHRCGRTGRAGRFGVAATFITPSQEKLAGDVIRALDLANNEVPEELRQLWDSYKSKMQEQGVINVKSGTGGFGGKGFRFDSEEQAFLDDRKRVQKLMFNASGRQDYSDDEEAVDIDSEIDKTLKSKTRIKNQDDIDDLFSSAGDSALKLLKDDKGETSKLIGGGKFNAEKLAFAKLLAARIGANSAGVDVNELLSSKRQMPISGPNNSSFGNLATVNTDNIQLSHARSSKSLAEQIAGKLNNKLNYIPKEKDLDGGVSGEPGQQSDVKVYEEQLEINDFPQSARWKVTSKETLANIAEYAEAAVTVKGKYFPSGKQPPPGESRLYLIIESLTERGLQLAKNEIKRLIKEEMMKMQNPALQMVNRGRYKVL